jgi:hypothetical protein
MGFPPSPFPKARELYRVNNEGEDHGRLPDANNRRSIFVRKFTSVDDKVLLNKAISLALTEFDLSTQQSCEKRRFCFRSRKQGSSG